jgi:hypothetical protein
MPLYLKRALKGLVQNRVTGFEGLSAEGTGLKDVTVPAATNPQCNESAKFFVDGCNPLIPIVLGNGGNLR